MSVSVLLVLGERGKGLVDDNSIEQWFSSYIGMCVQLIPKHMYMHARTHARTCKCTHTHTHTMYVCMYVYM